MADDAGMAFARGVQAHRAGDSDLAIRYYTEAIRLDPKYAKAYYQRGAVYRKKATPTKPLPTTTK